MPSLLSVAETDTNKTYVYISTLRTWTDARDYRREYYKDLAVIENSVENTNVYKAKPAGGSAWIGVYRVPWTWSDNINSLFRNWLNEDVKVNHCMTENAQHKWDDDDCMLKYTFICHEGDC